MSISSRCKRGNISERDKWGRCQCEECKEVRATKSLNWYYKNREKYREKSIERVRKWQKEHPDKVIEYSRKRYIENHEVINEYTKNGTRNILIE